MSDEVMIGDQPLPYTVAAVTPNLSGRRCSKDDLPTYAARYHSSTGRRGCATWSATGTVSRDQPTCAWAGPESQTERQRDQHQHHLGRHRLRVGVFIGMAAFAVVVEGRADYRLLAARHPWIRLVSILWMVACGAVVAFFAYGLAQ